MKAIVYVLHYRNQFTLSLNILNEVINLKNQGHASQAGLMVENLIISEILENLKGELTEFAPFAKVKGLQNITVPEWSVATKMDLMEFFQV